ncbi:MAG: hypothetical protein AB9883_07805 [Acidaminococcaceae bacterium]
MKKYVCIRDCFFQRLFRKGEIELFADNVNVPEHFRLIEEMPEVISGSTQNIGNTTNENNDENNDESNNNLPVGDGNIDEEELYLLLEDKTIAELKKYAADETIELGKANKKADIIKLIVAAKVYGTKLTDDILPESSAPDPEDEQKPEDKKE